MKKLHFNNTLEFETLFKNQSKDIIETIVKGIEKSILENKDSAELFRITFEETEIAYEISLPKEEWISSLDNCLAYYHENDSVDDCIDTWKLLEAVKTL